jgi:hypothetical protein
MKITRTAEMAYNKDGVELGKVSDGGVLITNLSPKAEQSIPANLIAGLPKGTVTQTPTHITIHTKEGDVPFRIHQPPGRYCVTCGEKLVDFADNGTKAEAEAAKECRDHVEAHGKKAETSEAAPHGYVSHPFSYRCTIDKTPLTERLMATGA